MILPTLATYLSLALSLGAAPVKAYWLMGIGDSITKERIDPIVNKDAVSGHVHTVFGGSNFGLSVTTEHLQKSMCTSTAIVEDKSNYWAPELYFQWANGSFTSVNGGGVIYYLFPNEAGKTTAFPKDFRMLSGNPTRRTYDPTSYAQQAIDFLCLDFSGQNGGTTRHNNIPTKQCASGIRSHVNFPSCWDGKNLDAPDHKSHVAFRSGGPDKGDCTDPKYPVNIPRLFLEIYWATQDFDKYRSQAKNPDQPFVFSYGDDTGYGNHADFYNGWDDGVLQRAVDGCNCNQYGDPTCCAQSGKKLFTLQDSGKCRITKAIDEQTTGTLRKLPGNNPVQPAGKDASMLRDSVIPALISPVYAYTGAYPTATGTVVTPATTLPGGGASSSGSASAGTSTTPPASTVTSSATLPPPGTADSSSSTGTSSISSTPTTSAATYSTTKPVASTAPGPKAPSTTGVPPFSINPPAPNNSQPSTTKGPGVTPHSPGSTQVLAPPQSSKPPSNPAPTVTSTPPAATTLPVSIPKTTKICKKKRGPRKFHHRPGKFHGSHHRRYDFDVDDYYHMA